MPVKLARLLLDVTIGCCFDSHPRIDSVLQNSGFRYGLLENAICGVYCAYRASLRTSTNQKVCREARCERRLIN
ncbi:MAG: hypothetical protein ACK5HO_14965 [Pseudomonadota bacterium]